MRSVNSGSVWYNQPNDHPKNVERKRATISAPFSLPVIAVPRIQSSVRQPPIARRQSVAASAGTVQERDLPRSTKIQNPPAVESMSSGRVDRYHAPRSEEPYCAVASWLAPVERVVVTVAWLVAAGTC